MDKLSFDRWTLAANWLSAIGTNAAVIVALWLAIRSGRSKMRVRAEIVSIVTAGEKLTESDRYFSISAVNTGNSDIVVTNVGWTIGFWSKSHFAQLLLVDELNSRLPKKLSPGEAADFYFPLELFRENKKPLAESWQSGIFSLVVARRIRVGVFLSNGTQHEVKPGRPVLAELRSSSDAAA